MPNSLRSSVMALVAGLLVVVACSTAATPSSTLTASPSAQASPSSFGPTPAPSQNAPQPTATGQVASIPPLTDVPFPRVDALGTAISTGVGPAARPALAWNASFPTSTFFPLVMNGTIFAGTADGVVVALDARTGAELWRFGQPGDGIATSIGAVDGRLFANSRSKIYAIDGASGAELWSKDMQLLDGRGVVVDGIAYLGRAGGAVGLDAATGNETWSWAGPDVTTIHVVDGVAYVTTVDGQIRALQMSDGLQLWNVQTASTAVSNPGIYGDRIYVGTLQPDVEQPMGQLYAIDRQTGAVAWQFVGPSGRQVIPGPFIDDVLYVSGEVDGLYALRDMGSSYAQVWHQDSGTAYFPLTIAGGILYQQRADGSIGAYTPADGSLLWATEQLGTSARGPIVSGGMLFESNGDQGVLAYAEQSLIDLLPHPQPSAAPTASATPPSIAITDPFAVSRSYGWADLGLAEPLGIDVGPDGLVYVLDTTPQVAVVDPADGTVVHRWGRQGSGPGEFDLRRPDDNPGYGDISVAPNGRVYVADGSNHRVQIFNSAGKSIAEFGRIGSDHGQFGALSEIEVGPDGSVYVLEESPDRLSKFTADGEWIWTKEDPDGLIFHGVATTNDGQLLMSCECGQVMYLDPATGETIRSVGDSGTKPGQMNGGLLTTDPAGRLYMFQFYPQAELVFDKDGGFLAGRYLQEGEPETQLGNGSMHFGPVFFPSPAFSSDGSTAYSFGNEGLIQLHVALPNE